MPSNLDHPDIQASTDAEPVIASSAVSGLPHETVWQDRFNPPSVLEHNINVGGNLAAIYVRAARLMRCGVFVRVYSLMESGRWRVPLLSALLDKFRRPPDRPLE